MSEEELKRLKQIECSNWEVNIVDKAVAVINKYQKKYKILDNYNEIFKLDFMLTKANIDHCFRTRDVANNKFYQITINSIFGGRLISVIEGDGTYGANQDLLEIMGCLTLDELKEDTVKGYLTAEEVFERIISEIKKEHKI